MYSSPHAKHRFTAVEKNNPHCFVFPVVLSNLIKQSQAI